MLPETDDIVRVFRLHDWSCESAGLYMVAVGEGFEIGGFGKGTRIDLLVDRSLWRLACASQVGELWAMAASDDGAAMLIGRKRWHGPWLA